MLVGMIQDTRAYHSRKAQTLDVSCHLQHTAFPRSQEAEQNVEVDMQQLPYQQL